MPIAHVNVMDFDNVMSIRSACYMHMMDLNDDREMFFTLVHSGRVLL